MTRGGVEEAIQVGSGVWKERELEETGPGNVMLLAT